METIFDFVIRHSNGSFAYVEVKNRKRLTVDDAKNIHHNLLEKISINPKYFILVSQDFGYLWGTSASQDQQTDPVTFPMETIVNYYFKSNNTEIRLRNRELEIIIYQWLNDLALTPPEEQQKLIPVKNTITNEFSEWVRGASVTKEGQ